MIDEIKGRQPIQDQSSVLGANILNNPRDDYYGGSSKATTYSIGPSRLSFSALGKLNNVTV